MSTHTRDFSKLELELRKLTNENKNLLKKITFLQQLIQPNNTKFDNVKHLIEHDIPDKHQILKYFHNTKEETYFITITFNPIESII